MTTPDPGRPNLPEDAGYGSVIGPGEWNAHAERINDVEDDNANDVEPEDLVAALAGELNYPLSGTVPTAAATVAKVATLADPTYVPVAGDLLFLTWTLGNTVSAPTLAVNGQPAKPISSPNGTSSVQTSTTAGMKALLFYDGATYWYFGAQLNTTYSSASAAELEAGTSSTGRVLPATIAAAKLLVRAAAVPASATAAGRAGQFADDGAYLYVCTATNTWRRTPIAAW